MKKYIIALDQGTTSSRAILFNHEGNICGLAQSDLPQYFPHPGWVEHNPKEILSSQLKVLTELLVSKGLTIDEIDSIGITNQRETTIVVIRANQYITPSCGSVVVQLSWLKSFALTLP